MPTTPLNAPSDVFVAQIGSKPLVVFVENWPVGHAEMLFDGDEQLTIDGEPLFVVVFD